MRVVLILISLLLAGYLLRWTWTCLRAVVVLSLMTGKKSIVPQSWLYRLESRGDQYTDENSSPVPFRIFRPMAKSVAPAAIVYHGATPHGENHIAIERLATALASIGFLVFVPRLDQLKKIIIDRRSLRPIADFYQLIQGYAGVSPGHVSVIGTSFAGGLLLKSLLDRKMQEPPPKSTMTIGSYCDLESTLRFILTGELPTDGAERHHDPDPWGQVIFFYNYLDYIPRKFDVEMVREVLIHYIQDQSDAGDSARQALPQREKEVMDLIMTPGNPHSYQLAEEVMGEAKEFLREISPAYFHQEIHYPFWVFHGVEDTMVPYTEALKLKQLLPRQVRLMISRMYEHREISKRLGFIKAVVESIRLVLFMTRFLYSVEH